MSIFLMLAFLFCVGSIFGWGLEVLYRSLLSPANPERRWINPGFCTGPWLPLYGSGLCILYLLADLGDRGFTGTLWLDRVMLFAIMTVCMTAIEYIAGILCLRIAKVRLWDYSRCWGNIQGIICPAFSLAWGVLGIGYFYLVHPYIRDALLWLSQNLAFSFVIGLFYGVFLVDLVHSAQLIARMKAFAEEHDIVVLYEDVKLHIRRFRERAGKRVYFLFAFYSDLPLGEHLKAYLSTLEELRKKRGQG